MTSTAELTPYITVPATGTAVSSGIAQETNVARLRLIYRLICILFAFGETWTLRYMMNPDGTAYFDIAKAYLRHDWNTAINSYWSPLYSWLLAAGIAAFHPSAAWEIPLTHMVCLAGILCALAAWEFLFREWERWAGPPSDRRAVETAKYCTFIWAAFWMLGVSYPSADTFVLAILITLAAILVRAKSGAAGLMDFLCLGLLLGTGYLAKSAMATIIPVILVILAVLFRSVFDKRLWITAAAALLVCAPFVAALSMTKHRLTAGDAGRLNYSWLVDGFGVEGYKDNVNVPGAEAHHPFALLMNQPRVLSLRAHLTGTFPVHNDPAWWSEGYPIHFAPVRQLKTLGLGFPPMVGMALLCPALWWFAACLGGRPWRRITGTVRQFWFILLPAAILTAEYWAVFILGRYLSPPYALVGFVLIAAAWKVRPEEKFRRYAPRMIAVGTAIVMALPITIVVFFLAGEAFGQAEPPNKQMVHVAEAMKNRGFRPGDKVAFIGQSLEATWLGLVEGQIVAEIPVTTLQDDSKFQRPLKYVYAPTDRYWRGSAAEKENVLRLFRREGARWVFADTVPAWADVSGWSRAVPGHQWRDSDRPDVYFRRLD